MEQVTIASVLNNIEQPGGKRSRRSRTIRLPSFINYQAQVVHAPIGVEHAFVVERVASVQSREPLWYLVVLGDTVRCETKQDAEEFAARINKVIGIIAGTKNVSPSEIRKHERTKFDTLDSKGWHLWLPSNVYPCDSKIEAVDAAELINRMMGGFIMSEAVASIG